MRPRSCNGCVTPGLLFFGKERGALDLLTLVVIVLVVALIFGGIGTRGRWGRR
jgi:hypothetical protein